ncbi:MAG: hypothetical protein GXY44_00055 [Phycisphaerales bacterium]|nr:hypothetical protein [Phycisphaerales bacterium]
MTGYHRYISPIGQSVWIFEHPEQTMVFDPVMGYRLTEVPSRIARITRGQVEYVSVMRGNNQGFPDRDDFGPERSEPNTIRVAVIGDSFTAGEYLDYNWPDRTEQILHVHGESWQLLNFALGGVGLANWRNFIGKLEAENYELDGVLFAVYPGDLERKFSIFEHRGYPRPMFGRVTEWNTSSYPRNLEDARKYLRVIDSGHSLTSAEFERALQGQWQPAEGRAWRPWLASTAHDQLVKWSNRRATHVPGDGSDPERMRLIDDIHRYLTGIACKVWVVSIPSKASMISHRPGDHRHQIEIEAFANALGASYMDGGQAFAGLTTEELKSCWFIYDGHWNQQGSDRFAKFIADMLLNHQP